MDEDPAGVDQQPAEAGVHSEGLTLLADPPSAALDVIFVHGFTGHARRTWTYVDKDSQIGRAMSSNESSEHPSKFRRLLGSDSPKRAAAHKGIFWPQHLLPTTLPNARIFTYGYDSRIRHRLAAPGNKSTIYDLGSDLLLSLQAKRSSQPSRPLVFIAHSLGGIVVKEALRRSEGYQSHLSHLHSIYDATIALLFFGTPHSGADPLGVVHHVAKTVVRLLGFNVNDQLVNSLLPSSERLQELREEFSRMSRTKNWMLYSFQEQYGLKVLNGDKVVEDSSATFGDPVIEITQHVANDHMGMVRFKGLADREYEKVAAAFCRISQVIENNAEVCLETMSSSIERPKPKGAVTEEQRKACLDSLAFQQIDARLLNIKKAHDKTCKWLLEQQEYKNWLDRKLTLEHHGFLWIKGKPGSGKSTMMKYTLLAAKRAMTNATIISFFFNARGSILEKSTIGMYRSLLVQLLRSIPALQDIVVPIFLTRQSHNDIYEWNIEELKNIFITAVEGLQQNRLVCFIDALDECEENEVRDMVEFLEHLGEIAMSSGTSLNICLSSRHYPHISIQKGIQLIIDGQGGHEKDIATYVQSKFKAPKGKHTEDVRVEILNRANGVFLWVVLVVQMLNKACDHGQIHMLRRRLNEIPDELDELFADILMRDAETRDESILCLQWLLFAHRPLRREELYFAVLSGIEPTALGEWDPTEISHQTMDKFILSFSKGLAEVSKAKDQTVQFIHESVRDFFILRNGLAKLQPKLSVNMVGLSQERLKQCCYQYIMTDMFKQLLRDEFPNANSQEAKDLRKTTSVAFPFLEYAVNHIFTHANAAQYYDVLQGEFLRDFESLDSSTLQKWINFDSIFQRYHIRRYSLKAKLLYILSERNLSNLVQALVDDKADVDAVGERYGNALQAASVNGHTRIVRLLIDAAANINAIGGEYGNSLAAAIAKNHEAVVKLLLEEGVNLNTEVKRYHQKPLFWAAAKGHKAVVKLLLDKGAELETKDNHGRTPLSYAAEEGYEAVVKLLLEKGAEPETKDIDDWTPLSHAAGRGHEAVVKLLLENGAKLETKDKNYGRTPLSYAAGRGHEGVVELLLEKGAELETRDRYYSRTPLEYAAGKGHEAVVKLLLEKGAELETKDNHGRTPLSYAAEEGYEAVVKLLLEKGAEPETKDIDDWTPLSHAAGRGHEAVVKLLLENGAKLETKDKHYGRTPLSYAAGKGHEAVVKLLLEKGAELETKDTYDRTPLSYAVEDGHEAVVKLLLENGAKLETKDKNYGRTPLSYAAGRGHKGVVELLLEKGAELETRDRYYSRTPLEYAAGKGHEAVVKLLLEKGAKLEIKDNHDRTPLSYAAEEGHEAVVKLLLEKGAELEIKDTYGQTPLSWAAGEGHW